MLHRLKMRPSLLEQASYLTSVGLEPHVTFGFTRHGTKMNETLPKRKLGKTNIELTEFGVGGFLGLLVEEGATKADCEQAAIDAVRRAFELGVRYFDTAPGYGLAEQLVADWVNEKKDHSIEIATKWGYTYTANFEPKAKQHEIKDHSLSQLPFRR